MRKKIFILLSLCFVLFCFVFCLFYFFCFVSSFLFCVLQNMEAENSIVSYLHLSFPSKIVHHIFILRLGEQQDHMHFVR